MRGDVVGQYTSRSPSCAEQERNRSYAAQICYLRMYSDQSYVTISHIRPSVTSYVHTICMNGTVTYVSTTKWPSYRRSYRRSQYQVYWAGSHSREVLAYQMCWFGSLRRPLYRCSALPVPLTFLPFLGVLATGTQGTGSLSLQPG